MCKRGVNLTHLLDYQATLMAYGKLRPVNAQSLVLHDKIHNIEKLSNCIVSRQCTRFKVNKYIVIYLSKWQHDDSAG